MMRPGDLHEPWSFRPGRDRRLRESQQMSHTETRLGVIAMNTRVFWIFGILQSLSLGAVIFLFFRSLNALGTQSPVGLDTRIVLSAAFPLFLLLVEYAIFTRK
jgi:hypothetical protein